MPRSRAAAKDSGGKPLVLGPDETAVLDSAMSLLDLVAEGVWPGLAGFRCALIYVIDGGQFLLNAPSAPPYYAPYGGPAPRWSARAWATAEHRTHDGLPVEPGAWDRRYLHLAFGPQTSAGHYPYGVILQDSPERAGRKLAQRLERWLGVLWHELFHVFQEEGGLTKGSSPNAVTAALADPERRRRYCGEIAAEQEILVDALEEPDAGRAAALLARRYLPARAKRYAALEARGEAAFAASELLYEACEGTAQYVDEQACAALARLPETARRRADAPIRALPGYGRFEEWPGREGGFDSLRRLEPDVPHYFSYQTGAALSFMLDRLDPSWKAGVFRGEDRLLGALRRACAR